MKERPILFNPENAQKIFDGVKTQTRRIVKLPFRCPSHGVILNNIDPRDEHDQDLLVNCPYGVVGDRLWIREAFCVTSSDEGTHGLLYRGQCEEYPSLKKIWMPSIHMPRWACRTVVEITDIRVQRIQEISYDDEGAEGITLGPDCNDRHSGFIALWNSINGADSWNENPWCWALSFKKVPG